MGTVVFIVLVVVLLLLLLGAGTYSVRRRYYSPAGSEVVETDTGSGAGGGIAAALIALALLVILFLGFTQWNWFGGTSSVAHVWQHKVVRQLSPGRFYWPPMWKGSRSYGRFA